MVPHQTTGTLKSGSARLHSSMWPTLLLSVFLFINIGILGLAARHLRRSLGPSSWPKANSTITQINLQKLADEDGGTTYKVKVVYSYTVNGLLYTGTQIDPNYRGSKHRSFEMKIYQKLKSANTVEVRYHPDHPEISCLSHGSLRGACLYVMGAIAFLSFGLAFYFQLRFRTQPGSLVLSLRSTR
jgi:hypothetical protein